MNKNPLGRTGLTVSSLGFGAVPAAFLKSDQQRLANLLNKLLDEGINLIDTAAMYPGSEAFIGDYLSTRREEYVLVSKCGQKIAESSAAAWTPQLISDSVDRALRLLKTEWLDVMLLHSCDLSVLQQGDAIGELVKARDAGKISHVGYSGDNEAVAWAATHPDIAVIETSINIVDQVNIDLALPAAVKHNVGVIVKRPIANAAWKDLATQQGLYKNYAKVYTERMSKLGLTPADLGYSEPPEKAWPEIALRFVLAQPGVSTAIVGTTNPVNALNNIAVVSKGPLPQEAVDKIRAAFKAADPEGKWTGQQ